MATAANQRSSCFLQALAKYARAEMQVKTKSSRDASDSCGAVFGLDAREMLKRLALRRRAVAASIHLLISTGVAALAGLLVFWLWYPGPFRQLAGGRELFILVTTVDVILGPVLTFSVFNPKKSVRHLRWDLAAIGFVQLVALSYGLNTVFVARPIAMVFEVDRVRMVTAQEVAAKELPNALPSYRSLPLTGPWLLGARTPQPGAEHNDALFKALDGYDVSSRPIFWQSYEQSRSRALAKSRPLSVLLEHYPARSSEFRGLLTRLHADISTGRFLPVVARGDWVAALDQTGYVLGYLPADGFF